MLTFKQRNLFIILSFFMGVVVIASNYLVQFPVQFYELENLLTYGAFSYPITFLITDLANRAFGKKIARYVVLIGFFIVIILTFSSLLTDSEITSNQYLDIITNNPILIVFIVIIRYVLNFLGKYNVYSLTKDIEQSLKVYLLKEVYKKGNYSLADATYYIETLSGHIAYFFNAFTNVMSSFIQVIVFTIFLTYSNIEALSAFGILLIVLYYPTKYLLVKGREAMEDSYKFSQFSARYIQRIIDNLFLVKIM